MRNRTPQASPMPERTNPLKPGAPSFPHSLRKGLESTSSRRRIFRLLGAFILFIILTEAGLRFILGLGNPILIQSDAACSYILKPDQDVKRFFVHTRINHYGM